MDMNDGICKKQFIVDFFWNNNILVVDDFLFVKFGFFYLVVGWIGIGGGFQFFDGIEGMIQYNNNFVDYFVVLVVGVFIDGFFFMENIDMVDFLNVMVEFVGNRLIMDCNCGFFGCLVEQYGVQNMFMMWIKDNIVFNLMLLFDDVNILMVDMEMMIGNLILDLNLNIYYNCNFCEVGMLFMMMVFWCNNVGEGNVLICGVNVLLVNVFDVDFEDGDLLVWLIVMN